MSWSALPASASWRHHGAREGFEVLTVGRRGDDLVLRGRTTALEDGDAWSVGHEVTLDPGWATRRAVVTTLAAGPDRELVVERDADGWTVDGVRRPDLDGCVDVDLESSAVTNTLPVHRLTTPVGEVVAAPAVFVRADLAVERLEQTYTRLGPTSFAYACPRFDVACTLTYDAAGLVVDYPGIAVRRS